MPWKLLNQRSFQSNRVLSQMTVTTSLRTQERRLLSIAAGVVSGGTCQASLPGEPPSAGTGSAPNQSAPAAIRSLGGGPTADPAQHAQRGAKQPDGGRDRYDAEGDLRASAVAGHCVVTIAVVDVEPVIRLQHE